MRRICLVISIICTIVLLSSCALPLFTPQRPIDDELTRLIQQAPPAESYPDADIIVLLDEVVEEVFTDGRSRATIHEAFKIVTERGKGYADRTIGFNAHTETISLRSARTITSSGRIIPLKKNAQKIVTPYSRYPAYSDYKELTFSMPGVRVGCIIEYTCVIEDKKPTIGGVFADRFFFQWYNPVMVSRYMIIAPETMELHYRPFNLLRGTDPSPAIVHRGGKKRYCWQYQEIPQILDESFMPPMGEVAFNMEATSMDSWQEFFRWWRGLIAGKTEPDAAIREKVAALTGGCTGTREKIATIFDYVKREIRYVSIGLGKTGYEPEPASEVFENKYGDCKDKSTLLISMLREAGITAHYVLIPTTDVGDLIRDFPYPFQFDHCIVAAQINGDHLFLDPTAEDYRFDYLPGSDQGRGVLIFKDGETVFATTPLATAQQNVRVCRKQIEIRADESIAVAESNVLSGSSEASFRSFFINSSPTEIREFLEQWVYRISPGARLVDYTPSAPLDFDERFVVTMKYVAPDYCKKAGGILIFQVPGIQESCAATGKEERRYPLVFWTNASNSEEAIFTIPKGYTLYYLPEPVEVKNPYFEFHAHYQRVGNTVIYRGEYIMKAGRIPPQEYPRYQRYCQAMEKSCERYVLFQEKK